MENILPQSLCMRHLIKAQGTKCVIIILNQDRNSLLKIETNVQTPSKKTTRHMNIMDFLFPTE